MESEGPIPAPWEASKRDGTLKIRGPSTAKKYKQREVCRIYGANWATVKLIVAAPELLAAIKNLRSMCIPGMNWTDEIGQQLLADADAAIEKAVK